MSGVLKVNDWVRTGHIDPYYGVVLATDKEYVFGNGSTYKCAIVSIITRGERIRRQIHKIEDLEVFIPTEYEIRRYLEAKLCGDIEIINAEEY